MVNGSANIVIIAIRMKAKPKPSFTYVNNTNEGNKSADIIDTSINNKHPNIAINFFMIFYP